MSAWKKSVEQMELEAFLDAQTRAPTSRQQQQAELSRQVNEFLRNGGKVQEVTGCTGAVNNFNTPISEHSGKTLEGFNGRKKTGKKMVLAK